MRRWLAFEWSSIPILVIGIALILWGGVLALDDTGGIEPRKPPLYGVLEFEEDPRGAWVSIVFTEDPKRARVIFEQLAAEGRTVRLVLRLDDAL